MRVYSCVTRLCSSLNNQPLSLNKHLTYWMWKQHCEQTSGEFSQGTRQSAVAETRQRLFSTTNMKSVLNILLDGFVCLQVGLY